MEDMKVDHLAQKPISRPQSSVKKDPETGTRTFFTEELYRQFVGPEPTLEMRAMEMMDALGYDLLSTSTLTGSSNDKRKGLDPKCSGCKPDMHSNTCAGNKPPSANAKKRKENLSWISSSQETAVQKERNVSTGSADEKRNLKDSQADGEALHSTHKSRQVKLKSDNASQSFNAQETFTNTDRNSEEKEVGKQTPANHGKNPKRKRPPMPEARKSCLDHKEHIKYLELFKKCTRYFFSGFMQKPTEEELQELKEFEKLQLKVAKEQEECQAYLKELAEHNPYLYTNLPPRVIKYMQEKEEGNWRSAERYARYYDQHSHLPLTAASLHISEPPSLTLVQTLVQLGTKCRMHMPDLTPNAAAKPRRIVPMEIDKVASRFPPVHNTKQHKQSGPVWNHEPASKDPNMEMLVHKYQCHVATSVGVIQQLLDNFPPDFSTAWDIPVVVREYQQDSVSKKVVYLDKPLLPQGLSEGQRKSLYLQKSLRAYMCQPHNKAGAKPQSVTPGGQGLNKESGGCDEGGRACGADAGDDDDPFGAAVSMEDLETFGSDKHFLQSSWKAPQLSHSSSACTASQQSKVQDSTCSDSKLSSVNSNRETFQGGIKKDLNQGPESSELTETDSRSGGSCEKREDAKCSDLQPRSTQESGDPGNSCANSALHKDDSSDSDEDGLFIDVATPEKSAEASSKLVRRSSRSSKSSIFDVEAIPAETLLSPRRVTRSAQKLQSPDGPSEVNSDKLTSGSKRKVDEITHAPGSGTVTPSGAQGKKSATGADPSLAEDTLSAKKMKQSGGKGPAQDKGKQGVKKQVTSTPLDSILQEMTPSEDSSSVQFQAEDSSRYCQPEKSGDHVGYHLWNLSGISLLVRCNNHAFIRDIRQQQKAVYVQAKPERQVQHGLEQVTLSECVHSWLGCYLRPNSYLLRARVNMQNNEVVHVDELQLDQILQLSFNFSPAHAFAVLHNIFFKLTELPAGSYLLSHESGSEHIQLKAGTGTKRGGFDLRSRYMAVGVMRERDRTVPWIPIDPTIILPHHSRQGLIPLTFQPPDFDNKQQQRKQGGPRFAGPKKKNKKKKKK